jgi:hypothetical protein
MFDASVINKSGQCWKLDVAIVAMLAGSFAPVFPDAAVSWTAGTLIAVAGYGFGLAGIRCARCGSRWFWKAATDASLYAAIFRRSSCVCCGHDFASD